MVTKKVYVEGGGTSKSLRAECRKGFSEFLSKAGLKGHMPRIVAAGSRQSAYNDYVHALRTHTDYFVMLLVDSEHPLKADEMAWPFLRKRDGWAKPDGATDNTVHLMVQCMEAWFCSDRDCLEAYFGQGFNRNALPNRQNVEEIPKRDVLDGLKNASRQCTTKGVYSKGNHSFAILARIDPDQVLQYSQHARKLVDALLATSP